MAETKRKARSLIKAINRIAFKLSTDEIHSIGIILIKAQRRIDGEDD